ncbi:hypothetical protein ABTX24_22265 [Nocardioides sp. NPDC127514]|uniref:hypothetical protein n=1 Tax=unclassified Nocardioides TaxID=2615069 RepID=UPI00331F165A
MDEGVKLFQLPVRVFDQGSLRSPMGMPAHETSVGVVCAGSTLVFQQTYAALVALLSQIQSTSAKLVLPTVGELADYMARVLTRYYRSLGSNRLGVGQVSMIVGGLDPDSLHPVAFELHRSLDSEGVYQFLPRELNLALGVVEFRGDTDACLRASELWRKQTEEQQEPASYNSVLRIVESVAEDPAYPNVGGRAQVGFTSPFGFHRVARAGMSEGSLELYLHGLPLLELGAIGSYLIPTLSALA